MRHGQCARVERFLLKGMVMNADGGTRDDLCGCACEDPDFQEAIGYAVLKSYGLGLVLSSFILWHPFKMATCVLIVHSVTGWFVRGAFRYLAYERAVFRDGYSCDDGWLAGIWFKTLWWSIFLAQAIGMLFCLGMVSHVGRWHDGPLPVGLVEISKEILVDYAVVSFLAGVIASVIMWRRCRLVHDEWKVLKEDREAWLYEGWGGLSARRLIKRLHED